MHLSILVPFVGVAGIALLSGCIPSPEFETDPIVVQTAQGPVTCQLYLHNIVMWDRSTMRPAGMTDEEANAACMAEGERIKNGEVVVPEVAVVVPAPSL